MHPILLVGLLAAVSAPPAAGHPPRPVRAFTLADYDPPADGTATFQRLFADVANAGGGDVTIPPGDYSLPGAASVPLAGRTHVTATGARFHLPDRLGDQARLRSNSDQTAAYRPREQIRQTCLTVLNRQSPH